MKNFLVFFFLVLILVAAGSSGCTGRGVPGPAKTTLPAPDVTTTVVVIVPTTAVMPATTTAEAVITTPKATPSLASADDIRNHFLDVAYTSTNRLERLDYDADKPRIIISVVSADESDVAFIEKTAKDFNEASPTVKLSENIKESGSGDIQIKFLPQDGLSAIKLDDVTESGEFSELLTRRELFQGNVPAAKILRGTIYINANLKGTARDHVIVRSLMYQMGLTGESTKFTDSVFYAGENTNTDLTTVDKKIITMLYADEFENGMTMEELRKVIYLP